MRCPRCLQAIHRGATSCPHCGFSLVDLDSVLGSKSPEIRRLEDNGGLLRNSDRRHVSKMLDQFQARFPQLFFAVHTGPIKGETSIERYGFWLMNRAKFIDLGPDRGNEGGILLKIDPDARTASMTWGYLLDPFFTEKDTFTALSRAHGYWLEERYADGMIRVIEQVAFVLMRRSRKARKDPQRYLSRMNVSYTPKEDKEESA